MACGDFDEDLAGGGLIEGDEEVVAGGARPAEEVISRRYQRVVDADGCLNEKVVRVFAIGGVTGGDKYDTGDEVAAFIGDAGGRAHFRLNAFSKHGRAGWERGGEFLAGSGAPGGRGGSGCSKESEVEGEVFP